jgi:hypothetical protein
MRFGTATNSNSNVILITTSSTEINYRHYSNSSVQLGATRTTTIATPNTWLHFVYVVQGTTILCYINGSLRDTFTSTTYPTIVNRSSNWFGRHSTSSSSYWNGSMDNQFFTGESLTDTQIALLFNTTIHAITTYEVEETVVITDDQFCATDTETQLEFDCENFDNKMINFQLVNENGGLFQMSQDDKPVEYNGEWILSMDCVGYN